MVDRWQIGRVLHIGNPNIDETLVLAIYLLPITRDTHPTHTLTILLQYISSLMRNRKGYYRFVLGEFLLRSAWEFGGMISDVVGVGVEKIVWMCLCALVGRWYGVCFL